uniref:WD repeat domain 27 n=1 Tax=Sphenodon punctatus TaxID=8508 RepID=A0A8D0G7P9_SPHPU
MEGPVDFFFTEERCSHDIVLEKQVFRSKASESHIQLACCLHYCAFPLNGNELCIWNTTESPAHQPLHLIGHHHSITALAFGSKINPLLICSASCDYVIVWNLDECTKKVLQGLMPRGIVVGTLLGVVLYVRFSPDDQTVAVCAGNRIYVLNVKDEAVLTELEGHLAPVTAAEFCTWEKNILVSVSEDRSFKVWDYCTGLLIYQSAVLTASIYIALAMYLVLYKTKLQRAFSLCFFLISFPSVKARCLWVGSTTGLFIINLANFELEAVLNYKGMIIKCFSTVFCLLTSMFENKIALLEINLPALMRSQQSELHVCGKEKNLSVIVCDPVCNPFAGDGKLLACGLADKSLLVFNSDLTGTPAVYSGHDGAVNSVDLSHDKKWLVSASEDRTLRIWSVHSTESALCLGKEMFHKSIRSAQFYYIDTFILLSCGAEFHLLRCYLDTSKDDLKRYKQKSICKSIQRFPMASTVEITTLSAVNDFYSYIVLAAGSNRALEVFDLNAGCSTAVIPDVHSRSVHQICQNKVGRSSFLTILTLPQGSFSYFLLYSTLLNCGPPTWDSFSPSPSPFLPLSLFPVSVYASLLCSDSSSNS